MNKQLVRNLSSVLVEIINETDVFPSGVMECILHQFEAYASVSWTPRPGLTAETGHTVVSDDH